jgi:GT2 family glycosyltransferase
VQVVLVFFCWLLALGWLWKAVAALHGMSQLTDLTVGDTVVAPPLAIDKGANLTIIVPACNEEQSIRATLCSLLASTGIQLQIIAVDDRSTDRTGEIMEEVARQAASDSSKHSLVVIHNGELPSGWLGKPYALNLAAQRAIAPWLLFTDADVCFAPCALELGLRYAIAERVDHLVLMPSLITKGFPEAIILGTIQALIHWNIRLWKVADRNVRDFVGIGGFCLLRTEVYMQLGGFSALRMEVLEDMSLGWLIKSGGFRSAVVLGPNLVTIRWIEGAFGIIKNIEKNGFAVFRYRVGLCVAACFALLIQVFLPVAAIAVGGWGVPAGLLTYLGIALAYRANNRLNGISPIGAVFFAPATAILCFGVARSMVLTLVRKGVTWRGTHYQLIELRRNAVRWGRR